MRRFNVRVYGILINERDEILLSKEMYKGHSFVKFPGGGVVLGESLPDALRREFIEECNMEINVGSLLHLTDILIPSAFDDSQVIGAYYYVQALQPIAKNFKSENIDAGTGAYQYFYWLPLREFSDNDLNLEIDKRAWQQIKLNTRLFDDGSVR